MSGLISSVFAIDVDGKPTVVLLATRWREAQELIREEWFLAELRVLKSNGAPLAIKTSKLKSRYARPEEIEAFERERSKHDRTADDDLELVYLVQIDEPRHIQSDPDRDRPA
jgi:hypothetical protein